MKKDFISVFWTSLSESHCLWDRYGKEPWPLSPAHPTSLTTDLCARLNALRDNIYSALTEFVNGALVESVRCARCEVLCEELKERNEQILSLKSELARAKATHQSSPKPDLLLPESIEDQSDSISVVSEAVMTGETLVEPCTGAHLVAEQFYAAIELLRPLSDAKTDVESLVCLLAVEDLEYLRTIASDGIRAMPWKMDAENRTCKLCKRPFGSFNRKQ